MSKITIILSQQEIGCIAGGFNLKKALKKAAGDIGEGMHKINQEIDKGARKVGELARELADDFKEGRQRAREEENEVPKVEQRPAAPADGNENVKKEV